MFWVCEVFSSCSCHFLIICGLRLFAASLQRSLLTNGATSSEERGCAFEDDDDGDGFSSNDGGFALNETSCGDAFVGCRFSVLAERSGRTKLDAAELLASLLVALVEFLIDLLNNTSLKVLCFRPELLGSGITLQI